MTHILRFRPRLLALAMLLWAPAAIAQDTFPVFRPSATGSYLAGQEAFKDMRTGAAARFFLDAAHEQWNNPDVVGRTYEALAADGRIDDAAPVARHLLELQPNNQLAHLLLGTVALKKRAYGQAASELEGLGADSFIGITASILRAWALVGEGDYAGSQKELDVLGEAGLEDFLTFHRALMADVSGKTADALRYARAAYEKDPYVARIVEAYARILGNAGRFDAAQKVLGDYASEGLSHPVVSVVAEDIADKVPPGKLATSAQQGAAEMYNGIGAALANDGSSDIAIIFLRLGIYLNPQSDVTAVALGDLLGRAGQYEAANDIYEAIPASSPMKTMATVDIADNLDATGNRAEAIRRLTNIVAAHPQNLDAVSVLGDLYRYDKQFGKAIKAYTEALEIAGGGHPRDWRFYYVRGIAYERDGQWPKAEADFQKALDLKPGDPQVLNYLGYSWVDQGVHLQQALEMIRQAVNANPADGYIVDSLGWAYYKLGRTRQAVQTLEQAVQLLPNDPEINDHLGDAYWTAGRKLEARFQWTIAADVDDGGDVAKRANLKLAGDMTVLAKSPAEGAPGTGSTAGPAGPAETGMPGGKSEAGGDGPSASASRLPGVLPVALQG